MSIIVSHVVRYLPKRRLIGEINGSLLPLGTEEVEEQIKDGAQIFYRFLTIQLYMIDPIGTLS